MPVNHIAMDVCSPLRVSSCICVLMGVTSNSRNHIVSECTRWLDPATITHRAETKLLSLRQERSASEYATAFEKVASQLNWGDQARMSFFYEGLKYRVKEILYSRRRPDTLSEYARMAVRIDVELDLLEKGKPYKGKRK
jgi:hypothetical protein